MAAETPGAGFADAIAELRAREPDDVSLARRRAAAALRTLHEAVLDPSADGSQLDALAEAVEGVRAAHGVRSITSRYGDASDGPSMRYLLNETHPIGGMGNPIAEPFSPTFDGEVIRADIHFGPVFEGTPGLVHGGFVAATFDHLLGGAAILSGEPIVTGSLTISYLRPTPARTNLTMECWLADVAGRKVRTEGVLRNGDEVLVRAEALFITVDVGRYTPSGEAPPSTSASTVSAPGSVGDTPGTAS